MILEDYLAALTGIEPLRWSGRVREVVGLVVVSDGPAAGMGDFCEIHSSGGRTARAQVVGFREGRVLLMPLEEMASLRAGDAGFREHHGAGPGRRAAGTGSGVPSGFDGRGKCAY